MPPEITGCRPCEDGRCTGGALNVPAYVTCDPAQPGQAGITLCREQNMPHGTYTDCLEDYDVSQIVWCVTELAACGVECGLCASGLLSACPGCVSCLATAAQGNPACAGCALIDNCEPTGAVQDVYRVLLIEAGGKACTG